MIARQLCDLLEEEWTRLVIEWREDGSDPGDTRCFRIAHEADFWRRQWLKQLTKPAVKPPRRYLEGFRTINGVTYAYDTVQGVEVYISGCERD